MERRPPLCCLALVAILPLAAFLQQGFAGGDHPLMARVWIVGSFAESPTAAAGPVANATKAASQGTAAAAVAVPAIAAGPSAAPVSPMDVAGPLACLRPTTPTLELAYPPDADAHFEEVNASLAKWSDYAEKKFLKAFRNKYHCGEGYCGPWIENLWIARCRKLLGERRPGAKLSDLFGPYIPILMPFVDLWLADVFEYEAMMDTVKKVVRRGVPYVAVVQHDGGLVSGRERLLKVMSEIPNLLVLSAGGYGHVPIPLLKQPERMNMKVFKPMPRRRLLTSYMGSKRNAPHDMRAKMITKLKETAAKLGIPERVHVGWANDWRAVMADSRVSMCPRGYGRTAFHVFEALQMGLLPVHVYLDVPWLPYGDLFDEVGFKTDVKGLPSLLARVHNMSDAALERMEVRVLELRESHFTVEGVLEQVFSFLTGRGGGGDLRCQKLPDTMN